MRIIVVIFAMLMACPAWAGRADRAEQAAEILQMDRLLTIRIRMSAEQWRMMQPEKASRLATAMAVVQRPTTQQALASVTDSPIDEDEDRPPVEGERRAPGLVGNQYAYIKAAVNIDGETYRDVGVRFKGQWSFSLAGDSPRKPLKLKFDHFVEDQYFHGIKTLSLSSNAVDPSLMRETLGFAFFRDAGLPASRTCFALIYLTVDGIYDNELLGLYTAIEEIDKDFLHRQFGTTKGLVIRPERIRNFGYLGNQWERYDRYNIQTDPTPFTADRFVGFTRLIHRGDDETFCTEIGGYVDPDEFTRFLAANVMMVNLDGVLVNGHNFYVHIHPETGRISIIPWDLHYSFGPSNGQTMEEWVALTIEQPYRATNRLVERMLVMGWLRDPYRHALAEFATGCCAPERMHARIDQLQQVIRRAEAVARAEGKALPGAVQTTPPRVRPELKPFVTARVHSVLEQLAMRIEGDPVGGRPAPPKPAPRPVVKPAPQVVKPVATVRKPAVPAPPPKPRPLPLNPLATRVLTTIDGDRDGRLGRDEVADAAKHLFMAGSMLHHGQMNQLTLAATLDRIGDLLDPFPPSADDAAPPDEPARPRPALTWAKAIVGRMEGSPAGQPALTDLLAEGDRMFDDADANKDGVLTTQEVGAFLDQLVPRQ